MRTVYFFSVFVCFAVLEAVSAAENGDTAVRQRKLYAEFNVQHGSMLNTHSSAIIENTYTGFDVRVGWQTDDFERNVFDGSFHYPRYGVGYYMGNLNHIILGEDGTTGFGTPAALYGFFSAPFGRWDQFGVFYDISLGLSYNFDAYDPVLRPYNVLIGTRKNAYINFRFTGEYALSGHSTLGFGMSFQHFSNGSFQKPNKGINLLSGTLFYRAGLYRNHQKHYRRFPADPITPSWEWQVFWANGVRMVDTGFDVNIPATNRRWYCTTLSSAALRQVSHHRKIGLGVDFFYVDWGRYVVDYRAAEQGIDMSSRPRNNMSLGVCFVHEVGYKKLWFITHIGSYITRRVGDFPENPRIYERVGVKYCVTPRLTLGVSIKAHLVIADYTEWTLGYTILKK